MVKDIVFASANLHKTTEIRQLLAGSYRVLNLADIGCTADIAETGETLAENAFLKSNYVVRNYKLNCFADDSGLEIAALNNDPGVFSACYSGKRDDLANLQLVLKNMNGITNRTAQFRTVISLISGNEHTLFEGIVHGQIATEPSGNGGFGYDPIFIPDGFNRTFAELSAGEKNSISHRAVAIKKMAAFLKSL